MNLKEIIKTSIYKYSNNSKAFGFINHPEVLRSKEVCNNLPSDFNISDIPMLVYNLNSSIKSTLFNCKHFVIYLNIN